jgi:hypothetical protein
MNLVLRCPKCEQPIGTGASTGGAIEYCRGCRREVILYPFEAREEKPAVRDRGEWAVEGEATCFYCSARKAVSVCEGCGSYLCDVCQTDWFGRKLCLACIHANREVRGALEFRSRATIYDNVALMIMLIPLFIIPFYGIFFAMMTAPVSLFLLIRHRRSLRGMIPRGPFRAVATASLAILLLAGGAFLIGLAVWGATEFNALKSKRGNAAEWSDAEPATDAPQGRRVVVPPPREDSQ